MGLVSLPRTVLKQAWDLSLFDLIGARPLRRAIQRYVEDPLSDKILMGEFSSGEEIQVDVSEDGEKLIFEALTGSKKA